MELRSDTRCVAASGQGGASDGTDGCIRKCPCEGEAVIGESGDIWRFGTVFVEKLEVVLGVIFRYDPDDIRLVGGLCELGYEE